MEDSFPFNKKEEDPYIHFFWLLRLAKLELAEDVHVVLRCQVCGEEWPATIKAGTNRFPSDKIVCPNECNLWIDPDSFNRYRGSRGNPEN